MKIGEVAAELAVEVHVLRHWDEMGVVSPDRSSTGRREYSGEDLTRLRVVLASRRVGMSLPDIRAVLHRGEPDRSAVISRRIRDIRNQRAYLDSSERFLIHVVTCTHDMLTRCDRCMEFAGGESVL